MRIVDLARQLIRLTTGSDDVHIVYTGLRKGEKLHEELFYSYERPMQTEVPKIRRTQSPQRRWETLARDLNELRSLTESGNDALLRSKVQEIVPEYTGTPWQGTSLLALGNTEARSAFAGAD